MRHCSENETAFFSLNFTERGKGEHYGTDQSLSAGGIPRRGVRAPSVCVCVCVKETRKYTGGIWEGQTWRFSFQSVAGRPLT